MRHALSDLLEGSRARLPQGLPEISGIDADSRRIGPGEAMFALPGTARHGIAFAGRAVEAGAVVIVTDRAPETDPGVPVILVGDVRAAYARAAARLFAPQPAIAAAVTGTNGKTSVASFVRQIWQASGISGASIGTLGVETESGREAGALTTPDPLSLHQALGRLRAEGIDHVALEASSHGLDQRRLDGITFRAVGFTNLTRDHLDYHADMQAYAEAKLRLFRELMAENGTAVVNTDDPAHGPFLAAARDRKATPLTVGRKGSWFEIGEIVREGFGQRVRGHLAGEPVAFRLPLTGAFQVSNALVALGLAISTGAPRDKALPALEKLKGARGRLELVAEVGGGAVFVDYAHTPDALRTALEALRPYAGGRLTVVFGCGGDRDRGKRPLMGGIASQLADRVIITDDNPRTEDPAGIRAEILAGAGDAEEIGDRRRAIAQAIASLGDTDVVLVAGKGHEDYQIIGTERQHFSDHEIIADAVKAR